MLYNFDAILRLEFDRFETILAFPSHRYPAQTAGQSSYSNSSAFTRFPHQLARAVWHRRNVLGAG